MRPIACIRGIRVAGWSTVVLQPATRTPPQPSHTETPIHIETRTHDQCDDTIEKSQAPGDGCINVRNMLSITCASACHTDTTPTQPHRNYSTLKRTHDQRGDTIEKSQAPDDGYIMSETCWA